MKPFLRLALAALSASAALCGAADVPEVKVTVLYDNTAAMPGPSPSWGFAALVEADGRRILFDTGGNPDTFRENAAALGVDLAALDALVISHEHWDHTQGMPALGRREGLPVYFPSGASPAAPFRTRIDYAGMKPVPVADMTRISAHVQASHEMRGGMAPEIALVVETREGLVVLVGCSHPGIDRMLREIRERTGQPILLVLGGFHLLDSGPDVVDRTLATFKDLGVRHVGAAHCTGAAAISAVRVAFGDRFVEGGVGTTVQAAPFARGTVR